MAYCALWIAHYGEQNFCRRLVDRGDPVPMQIALGHFTEAVMRMYFYLDGDFAPYWKWLTFEFRKHGYSKSTAEKLAQLSGCPPREQAVLIGSICEELKDKMISEGVVCVNVDNPYPTPRFFMCWFFMFQHDLLQQISDQNVRSML